LSRRHLLAECRLVDVVDERPLTVDLHHREPGAVARLQQLVAGDVDLLVVEPELALEARDALARAVAERAALRVEERDAPQG
jgi:hypothetical protein